MIMYQRHHACSFLPGMAAAPEAGLRLHKTADFLWPASLIGRRLFGDVQRRAMARVHGIAVDHHGRHTVAVELRALRPPRVCPVGGPTSENVRTRLPEPSLQPAQRHHGELVEARRRWAGRWARSHPGIWPATTFFEQVHIGARGGLLLSGAVGSPQRGFTCAAETAPIFACHTLDRPAGAATACVPCRPRAR